MRDRTSGGSVRRRQDETPVAATVAIEVVLLWPRGVEPVVTAEEAGRWPVFVLVIGERPGEEQSTVTPLFRMLDRSKGDGELTVVTGRCRWSVIDPRNAVVKLALEALAPERFAVEIIVPAQRVLGILDVVARGATIGVTTARHAARITGRLDIRRVLPEVVLFSCEPSTELSAIAEFLQRTTPPA